MSIFEILGYIGSLLIVISYCFEGKWLRHISNLASCVTILYGAGLGLWPVVITNTSIVFVNLWRLHNTNDKSKEKV